MNDYIKIVAPTAEVAEPFRFELAGEKFELPAFSEESAPLELLPVVLLAMNDDVSEEQKIEAGMAFLLYLRADSPKLWKHLKKQPNPLLWLNGLLEQWIAFSGIDPKASSSSS